MEIRQLICSTNSIESLNARYRRAIKARGHFPSESPRHVGRLAHKRSVRVARRDQLSDDTPQTSGLLRHVAFDSRNPDAKVLRAFLTTVLPGAATGPAKC